MDWNRLNLDFFKKESFDIKNAVFLNKNNMPLEKLIDYIQKFQQEFVFL
ncbi:MAG: hypothetical protein ABFD18_04565 [Syntrophomonas sp.]